MRRNLKWVLPISIIGGIIAFLILLVFIVTGFMRSCDAYKTAVAAAEKSSSLAILIGRPMKPGWFFMGSIKVEGSNGSANIAIPISGPKGTGKIYVKGEKQFDVWHYTTIVFRLDDIGIFVDLNEKMGDFDENSNN